MRSPADQWYSPETKRAGGESPPVRKINDGAHAL